MAQSVKRPMLAFGSGHDLMVERSAWSVESEWDSLCLPLSLPLFLSLCPSAAHVLFLCENKINKIK